MKWDELLIQERLYDPDYDVQPNRPLYTQDADRIVFSAPFRRLANKTQVHPLYDNDHIHHRLIHSVETSLVGRSLGMSVGHWLEQEGHIDGKGEMTRHALAGIVNAACLAHDIGNPPFGHSGEEAIGTWFSERFDANQGLFAHAKVDHGVKAELCKFEGNAQGFRLIAKLEMYRNMGGMRLSLPVLGAFQKYPARARTSKYLGEAHYIGLKKFGVFEAEWDVFVDVSEKLGLIEGQSEHGTWFKRHPLVYLVEAADDICYEILDLEDAFISGDLEEQAVINALKPIANPNRNVSNMSPEERIAFFRARSIGKAIESCVEAFKENYELIMCGDFNSSLIKTCALDSAFSEISKIAKRQIFTARRKTELEVSGRNVIRSVLDGVSPIFEDLAANDWDEEALSSHNIQVKRALNLDFRDAKCHNTGLHCLADFVSGMTDRYAVKTSKLLRGVL
ncbi:dGTP triphosphohydrolase [Roseovarius sp.]|uniref:dGTP triphosphohydrolase n=1 Tax=Roseovarius sp. TaxID=1486281 RepID=UPI003B5A208D